MERWPSGLRQQVANLRPLIAVPWVRIPLSPPDNMKNIYLTSEGALVIPKIIADIGRTGLKVVLIFTASELKEGPRVWIQNEKQALIISGCEVSEYTFTGKNADQVEKDLNPFDVIFVCGGNTFYLLQQIQLSGSVNLIRKLVENGKIYIGSSAGSVVAGPDIYPTYMLDRAEQAPNLKGYQGLGLTDILVFPHWGTERFRERYLPQRMEHAFTPNHKIVLLTDSQYLKIQDQNINFVQI